ncbi:Glycosyl transferase family 8 [Tritonibacter multivorans]|uniref:Glycosyl transferase family 8 n=1 Tax=Tritonibacter multivorans TaxID=928856 RepID=A0A0P1GHI3_9RHOB|nr:glycosyltransferase [Tritonibacter multivorans]MDA7422709.1 hypothetical protein [Tritonibacter multivorans]CUH80814.1 Glycosyl transferase family 8 [Tritonibacter multivorans]SFD55941.1 Glycosyl transferase family 8 [Tritonibacter multivorans]
MNTQVAPFIDTSSVVPSGANEGTVICSVVSDDFAAGFILMERSLRAHNPDWTYPIIAVHSSIKPLSELTKQVIREHCENVHFATTNDVAMEPIYDYAREVIGTPDRLFPAFALLEILRWSFFKRVIAIDSDVLIRGSLEPLLHASAPLSAVRAFHSERNEPMTFVNTGVMVLNETFLKGFEFSRIREFLGDRTPRPGTGKADQAILNILMHNAVLGYLPPRFNYTKRSVMVEMQRRGLDVDDPDAVEAFLDEEDVRIFHYVGEKPWNPKVRQREEAYSAMDAFWHRASEDHGQRSLFQLMDIQRRRWQDRYTTSVRRAQEKKPSNASAFERLVAINMGM